MSAVEYALLAAGMGAIAAMMLGILSDGLDGWAQNMAALMGAS